VEGSSDDNTAGHGRRRSPEGRHDGERDGLGQGQGDARRTGADVRAMRGGQGQRADRPADDPADDPATGRQRAGERPRYGNGKRQRETAASATATATEREALMPIRWRLFYRRTALIRAALLVFLLTVALLVSRSSSLSTTTHDGAQVPSRHPPTSVPPPASPRPHSRRYRADLRANVSQLAASLPLQRALLAADRVVAAAHRAGSIARGS
jgi:hypothetical protein